MQAATATDAGQTAYGAVMGAGKLLAGERVGIISLGGLGLTGAQMAVLAGAQVYAADPKREIWDLARQRGVLEIVTDAKELAPFNLDMIVDFAGFWNHHRRCHYCRPPWRARHSGRPRAQGSDDLGRTTDLQSRDPAGRRQGASKTSRPCSDLMADRRLSILATTMTFDGIPDAIEQLKNGDVLGRIGGRVRLSEAAPTTYE